MRSLFLSLSIISLFLTGFLSQSVFAEDSPNTVTNIASLGVNEHLGQSISVVKYSFMAPESQSVSFSNYFGKSRPVILILTDKNETSENAVLKSLLESTQNLEKTFRHSFNVVAVNEANNDNSSYQQLKSELGISTAHPPGIYVLTEDGKISRYLYGTHFLEKDIKFALIEASNHSIGSVFDRSLSYLFHFDSLRNSYTIDLWKIVSVVLFIQALIFGVFYYLFWSRKKRIKV